MKSSARSWSLGVAVVVIIAAALAIGPAVRQLWRKRDRPPLAPPTASLTREPVDEPRNRLAHDDWPQFRGPEGNGVSSGGPVPDEWSDTRNLGWTTELPGPGSSSPIVVGDHVFVTCYSGYGTGASGSGDTSRLGRHLVCLGRNDGQIEWTVEVDAAGPEESYRGYLTEHGYASHTPVSDGQAIYAFFGKSGVFAYDFSGNQLWHSSVGTQSDSKRWGSASSLILYRNLVIVAAASESRSIWALDRASGKEQWKAEAESIDLSFGTPALVKLSDGRHELAFCVPGELWGLNPTTGTLNWYASVPMTGNISPSVIVRDGVIYATGGYRSRGTVAVAAGGDGNVTDTHVRWSVQQSSYVPSPLLHEGHLYWVDEKGIAVCLNAATGTAVYRERLAIKRRGGQAVYASPLLVGNKLIVVTRRAGAVVLAARPEYEPIATNILSDPSEFNASPAIAGEQLFLRSNRAIFCISDAAHSEEKAAED